MYFIIYFINQEIYNWRQHAQQLVRVVWNLPTTIMYVHNVIICTICIRYIYIYICIYTTTILLLVCTRKLLSTPYSAGSGQSVYTRGINIKWTNKNDDYADIILLYVPYTWCIHMYSYNIVMFRKHPTPNAEYLIYIRSAYIIHTFCIR